eukprot:CAMPEP_0174856550 /NCGR_PEP_ID=MMETSP1114-20130205/36094_1 /TAXON_ID=312471 /ORGANISM="Neobodo designis, Strain CCAP 1951/1" /LENGTH=228 /DNA_ID=CAMNT_0016091351 /DNA_START=42 /DNA_END=730 /DNA_ORIENTATION=+
MGCACSADRKATRPPKAPRNRFWRQPTEQQLASFEASVFGPPPMAFADEADASTAPPTASTSRIRRARRRHGVSSKPSPPSVNAALAPTAATLAAVLPEGAASAVATSPQPVTATYRQQHLPLCFTRALGAPPRRSATPPASPPPSRGAPPLDSPDVAHHTDVSPDAPMYVHISQGYRLKFPARALRPRVLAASRQRIAVAASLAAGSSFHHHPPASRHGRRNAPCRA